jgi:UPF0716 protein FxsA
MGFIVLLLFIIVPITEIAVFIQVGDVIGLWSTLAIVILTAIIGTALLRQQGLSTLMRAQATLNEGGMPTAELFDGACLLFAGALLLTPGFVTDSVGFLLFIPAFRNLIRQNGYNFIKKHGKFHVHQAGNMHSNHQSQANPAQSSPKSPNSTIIDADFEEVKPNPDSPWSEKQD